MKNTLVEATAKYSCVWYLLISPTAPISNISIDGDFTAMHSMPLPVDYYLCATLRVDVNMFLAEWLQYDCISLSAAIAGSAILLVFYENR